MKLTNRIKKGIIQSVIFSGVFFLMLFLVFVIFTYPKISEIQVKKQELGKIYDIYNTTTVQGLAYSELRANLLRGDVTDYTKVLLKNITEDFYSTHFTNTGSQLYSVFLDGIRDDILDVKQSQEYLDKDKQLNIFLPTYNGNNPSGDTIFGDEKGELDEQNEDDTLTDFYFINYIENLLYSFNLGYEGDIGVGDIINIDKEEIDNTQGPKDLLQESIFAIPLSFNLVGRKSDMVDFLHYFENVAQIEISDEGFEVLNDNFINKRIEGSDDAGTYNIYENQLADIVSLNINEYPNSSVKTTQSLIYAMKTLQGKEKYEMDVELQFYVAGVPGYKMQAYINKLLEKYKSFSALLTSDTQKFLSQKYKYTTSKELTAIQSLKNLEMLVIALEEDITTLRKESAKGDVIEETYNSAINYNKQLEKINTAYDDQMKILIK